MEDDNFVDVDRMSLKPSSQRVRNILTLEERVRAIEAYNHSPMYTKVARMFNCSWDQIKNIIANRDAILELYAKTKMVHTEASPNQYGVRNQKIAFLGECMYEYIQRFQFHKKVDLTEELIRMKAIEFRDVMAIEKFIPNKVWLNHFKATYNFSLSNRQILLTRTPPSSMDLRDIMMYCTKYKSNVKDNNNAQANVKNLYRATTRIAVSKENDAALEELSQRQQRKVDFLERALSEYVTRFQYYRRTPLRDTTLIRVATDLKEILNLNYFLPNQKWLNSFKSKRAAFSQEKGKRPLPTLDLIAIVNYCGKQDGNSMNFFDNNSNTRNVEGEIGKKRSALNAFEYAATNTGTKMRKTSPPIKFNVMKEPSVKLEFLDLDEFDIKPNVIQLEQSLQKEVNLNKNLTSEIIIKTEKVQNSRHDGAENVNSNDSDELPKQVTSYTDALKLLKPLEEFALLQENFRAIGLISTLENIFVKAQNYVR